MRGNAAVRSSSVADQCLCASCRPKEKPPLVTQRGFWCKALAMTYSRMRMHTTIGAYAFHFRVRDGIGWFHAAMFTRERVEGRRDGVAIFIAIPSSAHALKGL